MAAGDVQAEVIDLNTTTIDSRVTALRVTARDKWLMTALGNPVSQVLLVHIEEA